VRLAKKTVIEGRLRYFFCSFYVFRNFYGFTALMFSEISIVFACAVVNPRLFLCGYFLLYGYFS
jgi:hypothetical protein